MDTTKTHGDRMPETLEFAWLELTNLCNLKCVHCYADSGPDSGGKDLLNEEDYIALIEELRELGCSGIQFIGGEPTLNRSLPLLIEKAHDEGFSVIEVFTNLFRLPNALLDTFVEYDVSVATSFYSSDPVVHAEITKNAYSFDGTVSNIRRILSAGLELRVGVILMEQNKDQFDITKLFLETLGVNNIGADHVRGIGRANDSGTCDMNELCGNCAGNIISISPAGIVSPCVMSQQWAIGSVRDSSLSQLVNSEALRGLRAEIHQQTGLPEKMIAGGCNPDKPSKCQPDHGSTCYPCSPNGNCGPNDCRPKRSRLN